MKSEFLEKAVFYEIYPTSFFDSNGDGVGDVRGMIEKIPYLKSLGIDGIWLNPLFVSPFKDGGYDIADYCRVDPRFGTNDDLKEFFEKTKECGIRVLLDLVMGHTSVEHPWFLESQKAEKNEYTDAFIWQSGSEPLNNKNGKCISGWAERPDMFMINFYVWQPALNYGFRKPKAKWQNAPHDDAPMKNRQRLIDVCKFWLSLGASGFRVDMANFMVKNDTPSHRANQEFWTDVIGRIKREYPESVFVSEWFYPPQAVGKSAFDIDFNYGGPLYKVWGQKTIADSHKKCFFGEESSSAYYFAANQMFRLFHRGVKGKGYQAITIGNHDTERMAEGRRLQPHGIENADAMDGRKKQRVFRNRRRAVSPCRGRERTLRCRAGECSRQSLRNRETLHSSEKRVGLPSGRCGIHGTERSFYGASVALPQKIRTRRMLCFGASEKSEEESTAFILKKRSVRIADGESENRKQYRDNGKRRSVRRILEKAYIN